MFHCLKCNCLNMSLVVKGNKKLKRTKTKNNNNKEILFNIEIACVSYVSIDILYIFCNVCIKKTQMKNVFIIIIITLYIYDYDYDYK